MRFFAMYNKYLLWLPIAGLGFLLLPMGKVSIDSQTATIWYSNEYSTIFPLLVLLATTLQILSRKMRVRPFPHNWIAVSGLLLVAFQVQKAFDYISIANTAIVRVSYQLHIGWYWLLVVGSLMIVGSFRLPQKATP